MDAYIHAFLSCYPHKAIEVIPVRSREGGFKYRVVIDHNRGDILLSEDDLAFATRMFRQGK